MRAFVVIARLLPFIVAFLRDRRRWIVMGAPARRTLDEHQRRADRLVGTLAGLGPTFIKLGQVFASRADLLPGPYLTAMARLTDQVPALAAGVAQQVIESELGEPLTDVFARFDAVPLAAASLGQVHRASYRGREVVVKVLRPGVEESVREDLDVAFRILNVLNVLFPYHGMRAMSAIVSEFAKRIGDEMDYREEAQHAESMRRSFERERRVVVPEVVAPLTRRRVLVLEFVEGTRIEYFTRGGNLFGRRRGHRVQRALHAVGAEGRPEARVHAGQLHGTERGDARGKDRERRAGGTHQAALFLP